MTEPLFTYGDKLDVVRFEINRPKHKLMRAEAKGERHAPVIKARRLSLAAFESIEKDYEELVAYQEGNL